MAQCRSAAPTYARQSVLSDCATCSECQRNAGPVRRQRRCCPARSPGDARSIVAARPTKGVTRWTRSTLLPQATASCCAAYHIHLDVQGIADGLIRASGGFTHDLEERVLPFCARSSNADRATSRLAGRAAQADNWFGGTLGSVIKQVLVYVADLLDISARKLRRRASAGRRPAPSFAVSARHPTGAGPSGY